MRARQRRGFSSSSLAITTALLLSSAFSRAAPAQQPPALVADTGHAIHDARGGGGQPFQIASSILGQTRRVGVVVPASFAQSSPQRRYPVTVVLDGESNLAPVAAVSDELARNGLIPEAVIVAIENTDSFQGRVHDLTPPGLSVSGSSRNEGGDRFLDFIEKELLPAVDRQFRGAAPRTLIGHSSGAILATWAAATRATYQAVVAIDAPIQLGDDWLAARLTERAAALAKPGAPPVPLRYAYYGARFSWPDAAWDALVASAPATWRLHREQLGKEAHETVVMLAAYLGLREAFCDYSRLAAPEFPTTRILPYYDAVGAAFGAPLIPPQPLLHSVVEDLLMEGRGAAARSAYATLVTGYGAPADGAALLSEIAEVERRPPPAETVEGLLATPFPTPEEAKKFLGEWTGDVWINPDEPRTGRQTLRIAVVDGRVVGETIHHDAPADRQVRKWEYLRITPAGLTFGFMNGIRPRGLVLFEGKLEGDTLAGTQRFGGIDFRPKGGAMPPLSFSFKRSGA
jgi:hypothetical protein